MRQFTGSYALKNDSSVVLHFEADDYATTNANRPKKMERYRLSRTDADIHLVCVSVKQDADHPAFDIVLHQEGLLLKGAYSTAEPLALIFVPASN
jgi:regulation of enolase protein 1 (concanavalin A-like superfamily)